MTGDFRILGGETAMTSLLNLEPRPSAVFVCNDMMAIGAIRSARSLGLNIPEHVSIVGFDDIPLARAMFPALTTMAQPITGMAHIATELLIQRIRGQMNSTERQRIVLTAKLIVRDSCRHWSEEQAK
jgi:LacI family transcriptional regulator